MRLLDGAIVPLALERYLGHADATDEQILSAIRGPVLDVGCGPGRHLHALARRGVFALGVDLSPVAVELARGGGGRAIVGSIFGDLPGAGTWQSALLLDGNIGIGGDPARLLRRVGALLARTGEVLVELEPPGSPTTGTRARIETAGRMSAWFPWARVARPDIGRIAARRASRAGRFTAGGRWFARLKRAGVSAEPVQADVAVQPATGEALRPPALRVEIRELARDTAPEPAPRRNDVVEHPGLDRDAAAGGVDDAQRPCLLGVVDQRGGADLPVAARRGPAGERSGFGACDPTMPRSRAASGRAARVARRRRPSSRAAGARRRSPSGPRRRERARRATPADRVCTSPPEPPARRARSSTIRRTRRPTSTV